MPLFFILGNLTRIETVRLIGLSYENGDESQKTKKFHGLVLCLEVKIGAGASDMP